MVKDIYGYTSKGGYLGLSRNSRRNRNNTAYKKLKQFYNNGNNKIKIKKEYSKKFLILYYSICGFIAIFSLINLLFNH